MNKKAIALSVNFLVTFVLAIVIFGFGMYLITTISNDAFNRAEITEDFLDNRIQQIACSSKQKICISNDFSNVRRGEHFAIGVFVNNFKEVPDDRTFKLEHLDDKNVRYIDEERDTDDLVTEDDPQIIIPSETKMIAARSVGNIGLAVYVPDNAESGKYVYTIAITDVTGGTDSIAETRKKITFYVQ